MTYFLVTGDEACDPIKLQRLIDERRVPTPTSRRTVRIEAENFRHLAGCALEDRNDKQASHALITRRTGGKAGQIRTNFDEPFTEDSGRYDVEVRYFDAKNARCRFALSAGGVAQGAAWESPGEGRGWSRQAIHEVAISRGDEITVEVQGGGGESGRLDDVQLNHRSAAYYPPPERKGGWRTLVPVNREPCAEQKRAAREQAGLDWDALAEAWRYTASLKTPRPIAGQFGANCAAKTEWSSRLPRSSSMLPRSSTQLPTSWPGRDGSRGSAAASPMRIPTPM